jgi:SAM-dependent methyltransferase
MVSHLRQAGLRAVEADVMHLDLSQRFDAAFAMNCLLHVPVEDLPVALASVKKTLRPSGLFYLGQYGGIEQKGVFAEDTYEPKRYFSWLTDDRLVDIVEACFEVVTFDAVDIGADDGSHFQAAVLRA